MTEEKEKNYKTEWSFSFEKMGDQINEFVQSMGMKGEEAVKHEVFTAPLDGAASANVRLALSVGEHTVRTLTDSSNLIEADVMYVGEIDFVVSGEAEKNVNLSQANSAPDWFRNMFGWIGSGRKLKWDVALSPTIPTKLDIHGGVGEANFDLHNLKVVSLAISMGTGKMDAIFPAQQEYSVQVNGGVGEFNMTIPDETDVDLTVRAGTGEMNITFGTASSGTARINGGIGECTVKLPQGAAVRVEAKTGIGGVNIRGHHLSKVRGGEDFIGTQGVWETPNYETAEKRFTIRFEGGIGGLNIR